MQGLHLINRTHLVFAAEKTGCKKVGCARPVERLTRLARGHKSGRRCPPENGELFRLWGTSFFGQPVDDGVGQIFQVKG